MKAVVEKKPLSRIEVHCLVEYSTGSIILLTEQEADECFKGVVLLAKGALAVGSVASFYTADMKPFEGTLKLSNG